MVLFNYQKQLNLFFNDFEKYIKYVLDNRINVKICEDFKVSKYSYIGDIINFEIFKGVSKKIKFTNGSEIIFDVFNSDFPDFNKYIGQEFSAIYFKDYDIIDFKNVIRFMPMVRLNNKYNSENIFRMYDGFIDIDGYKLEVR